MLEIDGGSHEDRVQYDAERDAVLKGRGLRVLRVTNEEVQKDLAAVLARIADSLSGEPV